MLSAIHIRAHVIMRVVPWNTDPLHVCQRCMLARLAKLMVYSSG